jgi:hypothetical protein
VARLLTRQQMLLATDISGSVFDRMINRGGMALTFGVVRAPVANRYIATDPIFARVVIDLAAASRLPQPVIATLVRLNNVTVLDTIVRAETESEPLLLAFIKGANDVQLVGETDSGLRNHLWGPPKSGRLQRPQRLEKFVAIDLTELIAAVRQRAKAGGFDLGAPLFLMPEDPRYAEIKRELLEIRQQDTMRLEQACAALRERATQNVMIP